MATKGPQPGSSRPSPERSAAITEAPTTTRATPTSDAQGDAAAGAAGARLPESSGSGDAPSRTRDAGQVPPGRSAGEQAADSSGDEPGEPGAAASGSPRASADPGLGARQPLPRSVGIRPGPQGGEVPGLLVFVMLAATMGVVGLVPAGYLVQRRRRQRSQPPEGTASGVQPGAPVTDGHGDGGGWGGVEPAFDPAASTSAWADAAVLGGHELELELPALVPTGWALSPDLAAQSAVVAGTVRPAPPALASRPEQVIDAGANAQERVPSIDPVDVAVVRAQLDDRLASLRFEARLALASLAATPLLVLLLRVVTDPTYLPRLATSTVGLLVLGLVGGLWALGVWWLNGATSTPFPAWPWTLRRHAALRRIEADLDHVLDVAKALPSTGRALDEVVTEAADQAGTPVGHRLAAALTAPSLAGPTTVPDERIAQHWAKALSAAAAAHEQPPIALAVAAQTATVQRLFLAVTMRAQLPRTAVLPFLTCFLPATLLIAVTGW